MSWAETGFEPFGTTHAVVAAAALVVCMACGVVARVERAGGRRGFADGFAGVVLGWNLLANLWWALPANFELSNSLPLHVCDLVNLIVPLAIWSRQRTLLALAVFWGLGLSTQAFFTPTLNESPDDLRYWLFWGGHLTAAAGCCVIAGGIEFAPKWKDWARVMLLGVGFALVLMWFNHVTGANYGYVGNETPSQPTLIDRLGPWPLRVVWLILIGGAAQALVVVLYPVLRAALGVLARPWLRR